jgi:hypothetical protein
MKHKMTMSKKVRSVRSAVQPSKSLLRPKIKIRNRKKAMLSPGHTSQEEKIYSYPECNPIIPFNEGASNSRVETYLLSRCKQLKMINDRFEGKMARINQLTGVGVMLDYIGCSLYDSIVYYNEILKTSEREGIYKNCKVFSKNVAVFNKLKEIFCGSYGDAYSILVD